jgi:hypothetical protein
LTGTIDEECPLKKAAVVAAALAGLAAYYGIAGDFAPAQPDK